MDEVTQAGNRLVILVEKALVRGAVRGEVLEDGQAVGAVRVDHARDAGGVVGCIRLKLTGAERLKVALALLEEIDDGVGLVAVGHDERAVIQADRMIDDQRRVDHLGRVERLGADAVLGLGEHAVAAVLRAAHNEICDHIFLIVRRAAENDAAARICIAHQLLADVKNVLAHSCHSCLVTMAPLTESLPAQKSDTACGSRIHSAFCITRF